MGYRMCITNNDICFETGKFYGYVKLEGLKSIEYLKKIGKIDDPEEFNWGFPDFYLTGEEFKEFIKLYEQDINEYDFDKGNSYMIFYTKPVCLLKLYPKLETIFENNNNVNLRWG